MWVASEFDILTFDILTLFSNAMSNVYPVVFVYP